MKLLLLTLFTLLFSAATHALGEPAVVISYFGHVWSASLRTFRQPVDRGWA